MDSADPSSPCSAKELLWLACRPKTCCHGTRVIVSGKDVWRIARALDVHPWDFTVYCDALEGTVDAFRLAPGGPLYQVALSKRGSVGARGAPCFFLWKLADGHAQCGLGALRPMACLVYPAVLLDGMLAAHGSSCTCRHWSLADLDGERDLSLLDGVMADALEYGEVVSSWNQAVESRGVAASYPDFCAHVMAAYAERYGEAP